MKRIMKKYFLWAILLLVSVNTLAKEPTTPVKNPKSILAERNNSVITIDLAANPSTGYRWILVGYDSNLLAPISTKYFAPEKGKPGQGGHVVWSFRLKPEAFVVPQLTEIHMIYARPWELQSAQQRDFRIVTD